MKRLLLIFLFIATAFIIQAQDAKRTKEQTIEYIEYYLLHFIGTSIYATDASGTETNNYKYSKFVVSDCKLRIEMEILNLSNRSGSFLENNLISTFELDLSKVEKLTGTRTFDNEGLRKPTSPGLLSITFIAVNGAKIFSQNGFPVSQISLPVMRPINGSKPYDELFDSKIFKDFNHLRKLCGAPEPRNFQ